MEKKIGLIIIFGMLCTILMYKSLFQTSKKIFVISDNISFIKENHFSNKFILDNKKDITNYNNSYIIDNLSARNFYDIIQFNEILDDNQYTVKQLISSSDIIIISIGVFELNNYGNMNIYLYYMDLIINEVRKINNNQIYLIGLYSNKTSVMNINNSLSLLSSKYNIKFINIEDLSNDMYIESNSYQLNDEGNFCIYEKLNTLYKKSMTNYNSR